MSLCRRWSRRRCSSCSDDFRRRESGRWQMLCAVGCAEPTAVDTDGTVSDMDSADSLTSSGWPVSFCAFTSRSDFDSTWMKPLKISVRAPWWSLFDSKSPPGSLHLLQRYLASSTYVTDLFAKRALFEARERHQTPFVADLDNARGVE